MGILKTIFNNTGKPQGLLGKMMVNSMNFGHAGVADWGMRFLEVSAPESIADLGCGGGRNAARLMEKYPAARLTALDHSESSVEKSDRSIRRRCKATDVLFCREPYLTKGGCA